MKMLNYLLFLFSVILIFSAFTASQKTEALKIIAKQMNVAVKDVETTIEKDAVDTKVNSIIDDLITRIRRQKVDEAKYGDIPESEIDDALEAKLNAVSVVPVDIFE